MRFETKFDRWQVVLVILSVVVSCTVVPAVLPNNFELHSYQSALAFFPLAFWLIIIFSMLPQYYELRENGLFIIQGWHRALLPYASLVELQTMSSLYSAAVFSADRILVVMDAGKRFLIAVAEQERFLSEVSKRCPQLIQKESVLGLPFAPSTIL
jgi:hypothetical protein